MAKARNWCLTIFEGANPPGGTWEDVLEAYVEHEILRFAAYGHETCPSTGRHHLQTYIAFWDPVRWSRVKHLFPMIHFEEMHGSLRENERYCSKEGDLVKLGDEPAENGKRKIMMEVRDMVCEGTRPMKIARETADERVFGTVARYNRFFDSMHSEVDWERRCEEGFKPPKIYIRYGHAGSGKSRNVWESIGYNISGTDMFKSWCPRGEYYNGYHGQPHLFFEDVQKDQRLPPLAAFKDICDGYPLRLNIKFGEPVTLRATHIWITSNHHPSSWFATTNPQDYEALKRRFTRLEYVCEDGTIVREIFKDNQNSEENAGNEAQAVLPVQGLDEEEVPI